MIFNLSSRRHKPQDMIFIFKDVIKINLKLVYALIILPRRPKLVTYTSFLIHTRSDKSYTFNYTFFPTKRLHMYITYISLTL